MKKKKLAIGILLHATISSVFAAGFIVSFSNQLAVDLTLSGVNDNAFLTELLPPALLIWLIAGSLWTMVYLTFSQLRFRQLKPVQLTRATGSIIAETLVVLPVYFMLTFGLMQMAIISMAGLLTTVGTYNAARTAAVWAPEIGHDRTGTGPVTAGQVNDKLRAAVAAVVAPVAPGSTIPLCNPGDTVSNMISGMLVHGVLPVGGGSRSLGSISEALEPRSFATRAAGKLRNAYCATRVTGYEGIGTGGQDVSRSAFTIEVAYAQPVTMPLVGLLFTSGAPIGWATPYQSRIERSFAFTSQMPPNPEMPVAPLISGLTAGSPF